MDLVSRRYLIYVSQEEKTLVSPATSPPGMMSSSSSIFHPHTHSSGSTSFPIIAIAIIGIMATAFLLVSYYIFVIKCCLNWHRIDLLRRFSPSRRVQDPLTIHSPAAAEPRGLEEAVIRLIPVVQYKAQEEQEKEERSLLCECAVCLNEFQEGEKLRMIPNCSHVFHIDCIDVWLQSNANCPLCRTSISLTSRFHIDQLLSTRMPNSSPPPPPPPPQGQTINVDQDFVVIELGGDHESINALEESPPPCPVATSPCSTRNKSLHKKGRKVNHKVMMMMTSMGDECIDMRAKDEQFSVQPIRRSFSMDSSGDRHFYLAVQEALKQQHHQKANDNEAIGSIEGCSGGGSGRVKRSFFSFGHGSSRARSSVLPVYLDP